MTSKAKLANARREAAISREEPTSVPGHLRRSIPSDGTGPKGILFHLRLLEEWAIYQEQNGLGPWCPYPGNGGVE